jgi:ferritin-like metal-binding protein YciE
MRRHSPPVFGDQVAAGADHHELPPADRRDTGHRGGFRAERQARFALAVGQSLAVPLPCRHFLSALDFPLPLLLLEGQRCFALCLVVGRASRPVLRLRPAPIRRWIGKSACSLNGPSEPAGRRRITPGFGMEAATTSRSSHSLQRPRNLDGQTAFHSHRCEEETSNMGIFTKDIKSMEDLLIHGLQDIYYAEQQILKSLPKMIDKATNRELVTGLKNHLEETNKQVERLQKVFEKLGKQASGTQCPAIDGIIKEADETAGEIEDKAVLDAAIVANAQAVEHYEMCRYGTLIAWAEELGHEEIVRFLTTNLNEEKAANTKLNTVALRKGVNAKASTAA